VSDIFNEENHLACLVITDTFLLVVAP